MGNKFVKEIDHGWNKILMNLHGMDGAGTKIGIIKGTEREGEGDDDAADMAAIAIYNEFGTDTIPARPAHAETFEAQKSAVNRDIERGFRAIVEGRSNPKRVLGIIGEKYKGLLQKAIKEFSDPPNAESTKAAKGRKVGKGREVDNPLIDTAQMVQSIEHVEEGV